MKDIVKSVCLVVLTVALSVVAYRAYTLLTDLRVTLQHVDKVLVSVEQAAANASSASATARDAALEQKRYWAMTSLQTYKVITDLKGFIVRTDRSVNGELVPHLSRALEGTDHLTRVAASDLQATTDALRPTLASLAVAAQAAAATMADPAIPATLGHVDETASNVEAATGNLAATTADLKQVADKFRETYTRPGSTLWATVKGLLHLAFETRGALQK